MGAAVVALLSGCSGDKETDAKVDSKFPVTQTAQQSPPDVNTVPTTKPAPKSTADEREKAVEGLVADRENARHADQGARTMPVAVRPLSDVLPPVVAATPPKPDAVPAAAVARLSEAPPSRPAEASAPAQTAAVAGPRSGSQSVPTAQGGDNLSTSGVIYASVTGYRPLTTFDATQYKRMERMAQLSIPRGDLSTSVARFWAMPPCGRTNVKA